MSAAAMKAAVKASAVEAGVGKPTMEAAAERLCKL